MRKTDWWWNWVLTLVLIRSIFELDSCVPSCNTTIIFEGIARPCHRPDPSRTVNPGKRGSTCALRKLSHSGAAMVPPMKSSVFTPERLVEESGASLLDLHPVRLIHNKVKSPRFIREWTIRMYSKPQKQDVRYLCEYTLFPIFYTRFVSSLPFRDKNRRYSVFLVLLTALIMMAVRQIGSRIVAIVHTAALKYHLSICFLRSKALQ